MTRAAGQGRTKCSKGISNADNAMKIQSTGAAAAA